ncbi:MAG TPA: ice-binding family protein [Candidatus Deferrimicrobium sp.]|nr:ice-binding family protein [Candidatus Deferrimicrobium sp.]
MNMLNHFTKILSGTMLLALPVAVLLAGCGGDDNPIGGTPDTTPPTVLSTNPINGATGVAVTNATFSEPMLASSISPTSFTVKGPGVTPVAGAVSYDAANNRALFVPSSDLAPATSFTATITTLAKDVAGNALASNYVWSFTTLAAAVDQLPVPLASTVNYAVLAGATITNTGATNITGDVGLSPGSSVTGFPPGIIVGTKHVGDPSAIQAKLDLTAAYNDAAGRTLGPVSVAGNLGGMTLPPGLYKSTSGLAISSGDLTLDAKSNANAVWIFQIASTLTTTSGRKVILSGGAKAANIFWQVGTSATLGTTSVFKGTIMADQSITINTGASLEGRVLARIGGVTLSGNTIVRPTP